MVYRKAQTKSRGLHAGMLRNKISLHKLTKKKDAETGYTTEVYNYADVWSQIIYANEMKDPNGISVDESARTKFVIRIRTDVTNNDYVQFKNDWYKVQQISRKSQSEDFLVLTCVPSIPNSLRDYHVVDSVGSELGTNTGRPSTNENWDWPYTI